MVGIGLIIFGGMMLFISLIGALFTGEGSVEVIFYESLAFLAGFGALAWKRKKEKDLDVGRAEIVELQNALNIKNNKIEHYRNLVS
jgi:hypothetical protein